MFETVGSGCRTEPCHAGRDPTRFELLRNPGPPHSFYFIRVIGGTSHVVKSWRYPRGLAAVSRRDSFLTTDFTDFTDKD